MSPAYLFQVKDTLGALADRCAALKIDAGVLHVSRLLRSDSRGLTVKRITMYSPNWVRSQNRMSSTSNQAGAPQAHLPSGMPWSVGNLVHDVGAPYRLCAWCMFRNAAQMLYLWLHITLGNTPAMLHSGKRNCVHAAQETFRVENVEGRVVLDILRHVLTACNLASFSLVDCCQSLLGRRLEVLPPSAAASLSKGTAGSERHFLTLLDASSLT